MCILKFYVLPAPMVTLRLSSMNGWDMFRSVCVGTCVTSRNKTLKHADGKHPKFARCLTATSIDKLQRYYGNAIRANVGNIEAMEHACWAVFYHSCSHNGDPHHEYYPKGADTSCSYIRVIYEGWDLSHVKPARIPSDLAQLVKFCWAKLCKCQLL